MTRQTRPSFSPARSFTALRAAWLACLFVALGPAACGGGGGGGGKPASDASMDSTMGEGGPCNPGDIGCSCTAVGACTSGVCKAGTCVACQPGQAQCPCRSNQSCDSNLYCDTTTCVPCSGGQNGCPCGGDSGIATCATGLACLNGVCASSNCVAGTSGCPCSATDPKCGAGLYCGTTDSVCRACSPDVPGCPCSNEGGTPSCSGGLVCDTNVCRAPKSCADLVAGGQCKPNQLCSATMVGMDAQCMQGCVAGYSWDPVTSTCVAASNSCDPNNPNGGTARCRNQYRSCIDTDAGSSTCGPCLSIAVDKGGTCVPQIDCGGTACTDAQYCDRLATGGPTCKALPCAAGQALSPPTAVPANSCVACTRTCSGTGLTGRVWPFQALDGSCICETVPGYFLRGGGSGQPTLCDADGDGWVQAEADDTLTRGDPALKQNSRCNILSVDGVLLYDEYGIGMEVGSCAEGLILGPPPPGGNGASDAGAGDAGTMAGCSSRVPMRLLESYRNDEPGQATGPQAPQYGQRFLRANELNGLTKACVSLTADYNLYDTPGTTADDISEVQAKGLGPSSDDQTRLRSFSYFVELYTSYYQAATSTAGAKLVIREKSRCAPDFPLHYDPSVDPSVSTPSDLYTPTNGGTYWRNCYRKRDPAYNPGQPGFDFAQWTCPATSGSCPTPPPASATVNATPPYDSMKAVLRNTGLCELGGLPPFDGVWRGLGAHSQFQCINLTSTPTHVFDRSPAQFAVPGGNLELNVCGAVDCTGSDASSCVDSLPTTPGSTWNNPVIQCHAWDPTKDVLSSGVAVGWAAVRYTPYGANSYATSPTDPTHAVVGADGGATGYVGGCVDEDSEWGADFCPSPEYKMTPGTTDAFGRYSCFGNGAYYLWCATGQDGGPVNVQWETLIWGSGTVVPEGGVDGSVWRQQ